MRWEDLPFREVPIDRLVWPCHDIDPGHLHPRLPPVTEGPIWVEALVDGSFFVHDGRHRSIRAREAGAATIPAFVLDSRR